MTSTIFSFDFSPSQESSQISIHEVDATLSSKFHLAGFEQGYTAGWEDAERARKQSFYCATRILSRTMDDIIFTHNDAQTKLLLGAIPVFEAIVSRLLPRCLDAAAHLHVLDALQDLLEANTTLNIRIVTGSEYAQALSEVISTLPRNISALLSLVIDSNIKTPKFHLLNCESNIEIDINDIGVKVDAAISKFGSSILERSGNEK